MNFLIEISRKKILGIKKKTFSEVDFHKAAYSCEKTSFDNENNSHALIIFHVEKNELKDLDPKVDFLVKNFPTRPPAGDRGLIRSKYS